MRNEGLGSWIARRARMGPERVALVFGEERRTYRELQARVDRLAHGLASLGVGRGDRVAYAGPNHPAFLETLFAAGSLGAAFVPVNHRLAPPEVAYILEHAGCAVLVHAPEAGPAVEPVRDRVPVGRWLALAGPSADDVGYEELVAAHPPDPLDEPVSPDDLCILAYTSGTTGRPKGVMLTHANVTWNVANFLSVADFASDDVTLAFAPFYRIGSLGVTVLPTIFKGGTVVVAAAVDPELALELIQRHRVTTLFAAPDLLAAMARSERWERTDLSTVRFCLSGGAPVPEELIRTYLDRGIPFLQGFGLTEAAPLALLLDRRDAVRKVGSAGLPPFFTDVRVVRPDMTDVGPGEVGEIVVRGPNVMAGYWRDPEATAAAIANGWLRTGDAARVDAEGFAYIVDRIKDVFVTGGEPVYPAEVERALREHPAVAEAAIVGRPDERLGEVGHAFVVLRPGAATAPEELLRSLEGKVAGFKVPRTAEVVEELPRNPAGKILKQELRRRLGG